MVYGDWVWVCMNAHLERGCIWIVAKEPGSYRSSVTIRAHVDKHAAPPRRHRRRTSGPRFYQKLFQEARFVGMQPVLRNRYMLLEPLVVGELTDRLDRHAYRHVGWQGGVGPTCAASGLEHAVKSVEKLGL